ncbi:vitelline membrane outer layer protein 1 homolog [Xenopus tropicalis]|nr:vitelline membrane outer layer protein 1 homolog [Xenopus tropicalis]
MIKLSFSLILFCLFPFGNAQSDSPFVMVPYGGPAGQWTDIEYCPPGTKAKGFSVKMKEKEGIPGDSALNGLRLYCTSENKADGEYIVTSTEGQSGTWSNTFRCMNGFLSSFCLRVSPPKRIDDDMLANIKFRCRDSLELEGSGSQRGFYGPWSGKCSDYICGIQTKVTKQGDVVIDFRFYCCDK